MWRMLLRLVLKTQAKLEGPSIMIDQFNKEKFCAQEFSDLRQPVQIEYRLIME